MASDAELGALSAMKAGAAIATRDERARCLAWGRLSRDWEELYQHIQDGDPIPPDEPDALMIRCDVVGCDTSMPMVAEEWEDGAPRGWRKYHGRLIDSCHAGMSTAAGAFSIATHGLVCHKHPGMPKEDSCLSG